MIDYLSAWQARSGRRRGGRAVAPLLALCGLLVPFCTWGQVGDTTWLHEVVISTDSSAPPRPLGHEVVPIRIVTHADIVRLAPTSIEELLQFTLPDVSFGYAMDQQTAINIQGQGGGAVLFLLDGERMAGESIDNIDYNRLVLADIERVEVSKGSAPPLYSSASTATVVNIITRRPQSDALRMDAQWGADHLGRYSAAATLHGSKLSSATAGEYYHREAVHLADVGELTTLYPTSHLNLHQRFTYEPNERLQLGARASYYYRYRSPDPTHDDRYRDFGAGLRADWQASASDCLQTIYSFDEYHKSNHLIASGLDLLTYSNVQHALRALYTHHHPGDALRLGIGADYLRDYLLSYQFANGESHQQHTASLFAEADWWPVGAIEVQGALRLSTSLFPLSTSHFPLSTSLAVKYTPGSLALRGAWASGFRTPTLKERYMDFDMAGIFTILGNPDLQPETTQSLTLGADYAAKHLSWSASTYLNYGQDRIVTLWSAARQGMVYHNAGRTRLLGIDLTLAYAWDFGLGLRASYTFAYQQGGNDSPQLGLCRPHTASVQVDYSHVWRNRRSSVSLSGRLLSSAKAAAFADLANPARIDETTYPGYALWKLTLRQQLCDWLDLTLTVDNLLNYVPDYYYNTSPATKGITLLSGLHLTLERD